MQFHILDENNTPVAVMDNALPEAIHFKNSKFHRFLTGSADFFDFDISKIQVDHSFLKVGYWIAFKYGNRDNLLYISDIEEFERDKMMSISSMSQNLDLNLENTPAFAADKSYPIKWYFDRILFDTGYEIGINEISNLSRKLSWDSDMTHRAFLQSVATQFDNAELDYEVQLNSDFTIKKRLIHIKKKVGQVREDIELRYGHNVKTVKRKTSINPLYTAIRPISKDDNDKITTIADYPDWQVLDENGNVKFFHKKGEEVIKAPLANAQFGNRGTNVNGGGYIVYDYSFDKISQSELFNRSSKMLEDLSVPTVTYDAEGRTGANVGDTVKIVDDGYDPQLIVSARVLEKIDSFDDASIEQASFGNYKALQSQISDDLIGKMQKLAEENAPYNAQTLTTNGLQFKNSTGSTLLTARVYKGAKEIVPDSYVWTKDDTTLSGSAGQRTISATDVNQKSVIRWSAIINENIVASDEVTITDVSDGKGGQPGPQGATGATGATGPQGASGKNGTDGKEGAKGDPTGVTKQATEPVVSQRFIGMLWQYTGTSSIPITGTNATPNAIYRWTDNSWELWYFYAVNMQADSLSAISANLGTMVAGVIKILADIIVNAAGKTKKFGMLFTKKGILSTGPVFSSSGQISETKMAVASLTQGELRFLNTGYNDNLEQVQDSGTSSANNGFIRFSSTDKGDLLEINSSGRILLNGITTQTSPWIKASSLAQYRVAFGTVTVGVDLVNGNQSSAIYLGNIPPELRPLDGRMLYAGAWWPDNSRDRHFQINRDDGNMSLLSPYPGQLYKFEVVWSIPY